MDKKLKELASKIGIENYLIHKEGDHYYLLDENDVTFQILLQKNSDIVIWAYDIPKLEFKQILQYIEEVFKKECIIFPFVENDDNVKELIEAGYSSDCEFDDEDADIEIKKYSSYKKMI